MCTKKKSFEKKKRKESLLPQPIDRRKRFDYYRFRFYVHTFAEHITPINHLTVVTASLKTSLLLNTINNIEVIQLGGIVRKNSFSVIGDYTSLFF